MASNASIDKSNLISLDFEKEVPGAKVPDECMAEIVDRLIATINPAEGDGVECLASDSENLLTRDQQGCLRVQADQFCEETQDIPVPPASLQGGDVKYRVSITRFVISQATLGDGSVVVYPGYGQTGGEGGTVATDLQELADNLNAENAAIVWTVEQGFLTGSPVSGEVLEGVIETSANGAEPHRFVTAQNVSEGSLGNAIVDFTECAAREGIDYASVFQMTLDILPGDGYERAYRIATRSDRVTYRITQVSKPLVATLKIFTPASRETEEEF